MPSLDVVTPVSRETLELDELVSNLTQTWRAGGHFDVAARISEIDDPIKAACVGARIYQSFVLSGESGMGHAVEFLAVLRSFMKGANA